jgi:GWxTD domain-containing protein
MPHPRGARALAALLATLLLTSACASRPSVGADGRPLPQSGRSDDPATAFQPVNVVELYKGMGLIAAQGSAPFVGRVAFLPDQSPDSTLVLVSLSFAPRSVAFAREGEQYAGRYTVRLDLRRGITLVRRLEATETVRVATFRETSRQDESVIWQQYLRVAPGQYTLNVALRDEGSPRGAAEEVLVTVPKLDAGMLASPVPVYEVLPRSAPESLPRLLARPRATVMFGGDSVVPVYLEIGGTRQATSVRAEVVGEGDAVLWRDSTVLLGRGGDLVNGVLQVPAAELGIGVVTLRVTQSALPSDTAATRLLVTLGDDLPVANFEELVRYLRFFAPDYKLEPLTKTSGAERAKAWNTFLRTTDPIPGTPEHEGLRDYFARIRLANQRFREDGPAGWLSERGMAFVGLGDPDNIIEPMVSDMMQRGRQQVWVYSRWRLQLVFFDQTGIGRWRLSPSASVELQATIRRRLAELP